MDFKQKIKPFFWVENGENISLCLNVGEYKCDLFLTRKDEGFEGNGYDWTSLAKAFILGKMPQMKECIQFDPESSMFCAYSSDRDALQTFAIEFKNACENKKLIQDIFLKAEID